MAYGYNDINWLSHHIAGREGLKAEEYSVRLVRVAHVSRYLTCFKIYLIEVSTVLLL